jgi:TrmH family RNA methyltransferase
VLREIGETSTPAGVVAVCRDIRVGLETVLASSPRLLVVLADVRDPGNAGTIIRTADAAGADGVVLLHGSVDPLGGKCVRSTVGSLFHLPVSSGHPASVLDALRSAGLRVLAADSRADVDLDEAAASGLLDEPTAWVVGNEAWGLPDDLRARADTAVRVPLYGRAESLNVAVAASLCLYASARVHRARGAT